MPRTLLAVIAVVALAAGACGGDEEVRVDDAWARTSPRMADAGAAYLRITSPDADRILSASVSPSIAAAVEVHETVMTGDAMAMQQVESIELPAGETVSLEPGGYHVMLLQLADPLEVGEVFDLTLMLENAGEVTVAVEVRDEAP